MKLTLIAVSIFTLSLLSCGSGSTERAAQQTEKTMEQNTITEKYWKLKTLNGKDVVMGENQLKEVNFTLKNAENRISGFGGCNEFSGKYTLADGNSISFSEIISTKMYCENPMFNESDFFKMLGQAKTYEADKDMLTLQDASGKKLATFEAIYF
ncbi:META domain-containing protein [Aequorivita echinoideorum]|uniref:META domain-containing protein n=1 Tax=Aequorivita echinoideorum TaxID=1549647 RepID=A0ABS5S7Z8_9FLAO|nr:META domain-containing protein [Aequorivita echinoideorum]MBT0608565.1 META domain-containing protein [Aequorivita echinoideorum]